MTHSPTLEVLRQELARWRGGRDRLVEAMRSTAPHEVVTNLLQIRFDPVTERLVLEYVVADPAYPTVELTYRELRSVLAEP